MQHPAARGNQPALPRPCAPISRAESYISDRDRATRKAPEFDHDELAALVDGLWLSDASVAQDPHDWPAWTDLPLEAVLAMLGGGA